jgi:hypothetical protein
MNLMRLGCFFAAILIIVVSVLIPVIPLWAFDIKYSAKNYICSGLICSSVMIVCVLLFGRFDGIINKKSKENENSDQGNKR